MESRKMVLMNIFVTYIDNELVDTMRERKDRMSRESSTDIYTTMCKILIDS